VRTRAIAHLLTTELFGQSLIIAELTRRRDLAGIGLSDSKPASIFRICTTTGLSRNGS